MNIKIRKPQKEDLIDIKSLFQISVRDAYNQNNIKDLDDEKAHIERQISQINNYFKSNAESHYLLAIQSSKVVGIIAAGKPSQKHYDNLGYEEDAKLIRSAYILPSYQGKGIGSRLFERLIADLQKDKVQYFYIDAGYGKSQGYWINKLGSPDKVLKNYYGNSDDLLFWKREVKNFLNRS
jgi:GNAT superfamily N-acetyltransferase